jgi:hypothetical protein
MKLGIIQGRLLKPIDGNIQEFPKANWYKEFNLIDEIRLTHIEWIITRKSFDEGVLNLNIKSLNDKISSITCDNLISELIFDSNFLSKELRPICEWCVTNGIKCVSIPLLEDSKLTHNNKHIFFNLIKSYSLVFPKLEFHFEMESDWDIAMELVSLSDNFYLIYDTGNMTSCKFDHEEWLTNCIDYIKNIHIKDRTINPIKTVEPLTGDTDFELIFNKLNELNYNGLFTLQLARGEEGKEVGTTIKHIQIFKNIYEKKFI